MGQKKDDNELAPAGGPTKNWGLSNARQTMCITELAFQHFLAAGL
jgi:hypothetical protein